MDNRIRADHRAHVERDGHYRASVSYMSNELGSVMIEACDAGCGWLVVHCEHRDNTWDQTGTKLTCNLCKTDGT